MISIDTYFVSEFNDNGLQKAMISLRWLFLSSNVLTKKIEILSVIIVEEEDNFSTIIQIAKTLQSRSLKSLMTPINTPHLYLKVFFGWVRRVPKTQTRHGPRNTWPPTSTDVWSLISDALGRPMTITLSIAETYRGALKGVEKIHIYRADFRRITDAQDSSSSRLSKEETQTWWTLWFRSSKKGFHKKRRRQKFWVMIDAVTPSRHRGALWSVLISNAIRENDIPMLKMSYSNCVHWIRR